MIKEQIKDLFTLVKEKQPLVHHLTNAVTINDCANVTLAIGGRPVMASAIEEVADMVGLAQALVINFGTMNDDMYEAIILAGQTANQKGIPVIFDPVGVGATSFRTDRAQKFLEKVKPSIIRGNASEVFSLIGGEVRTRGVDSADIAVSKEDLVKVAAKELHAIVVISGEQDFVSDGTKVISVHNGDTWLTKISGTGCMTASLIGCFSGITNNLLAAAVAGMSTMSLAGERVKKQLKQNEGIGTYRVKLMDEIFLMDGDRWDQGVKLR
ncbi:hydroxyethylthiazole kinase [Niallia sp. Krafla_26]|uniref:hydroxyethylthiazole kinase n=1 Tax=Niallia sp. Krafla_26 TaxID=3064703 RepID=UPI003D184C5D